MPARFTGSAVRPVTRCPSAGVRRTSRSRSTASGKRELLTRHPADESSAADLAARLEPPVHARRARATARRWLRASAAGGRRRRSGAAAPRPACCDGRRPGPLIDGRRSWPVQRPVKSRCARARSPGGPRAAHTGAQARESIRRGESAGDERADRLAQRIASSPQADASRAGTRRRARAETRARGRGRRRQGLRMRLAGARAGARHRGARAGRERSAWPGPAAVAANRRRRWTAAPSRSRRSGTACRASTARSRRRAPAGPSRSQAPRRQLEAVELRRATSRSPSSPVSRVAGSTCCHAKRKRMKSAGLTGSISARSRLSV